MKSEQELISEAVFIRAAKDYIQDKQLQDKYLSERLFSRSHYLPVLQGRIQKSSRNLFKKIEFCCVSFMSIGSEFPWFIGIFRIPGNFYPLYGMLPIFSWYRVLALISGSFP